ncbi:MAG: restriction endonuclease [Planctomycetes bacterium RBG_13_63_9]|nr:MAG: restriction endonuclease [Planctomycetes bacterium RBG_13_63_9]
MFYYPNRAQAIRIQQALHTLYEGMGGEYHFGNSAWDYVKQHTDIDLLAILQELAEENTKRNGY